MSTDLPPCSRRRLLALAAATAAAAGCGRSQEQRPAEPDAEAPLPDGVFDAGPLSQYQQDGPDDSLRDNGFFVIRRDAEVCALSAVCTHQGCLVSAQPDASFKCFCHGSRFSPEGVVQNGPADRDLPRLAVRVDPRGHLLVDTKQPLQSAPTDAPPPEDPRV